MSATLKTSPKSSAAADYVVANNGSLEDLDREADRVWDELVHQRADGLR